MNTLFEDLKKPLDMVERKWIRLPATILLAPIALLIGMAICMVGGARIMWISFVVCCWKGSIDKKDML